MDININPTQIVDIITATSFISLITLVLRLQIELTKAKKDIEHLTNEIKELKDLLKDCMTPKKD